MCCLYDEGFKAGRFALADSKAAGFRGIPSSKAMKEMTEEVVHAILYRSTETAFTPAERLYFVLAPKDRGDRAASAKLWTAVCGNSDPESKFLEGFIDGLIESE